MSVPKWLINRPVMGVLCDITGVLYEGGAKTAISGSVEAIQRLKESGIPVRFVTNETQRTRKSLAERLRGMGFAIEEREIIAPGPVTCQNLLLRSLRPFLLVYPDVLPEFGDCNSTDPNCVVLGDAADQFTYENLNKAFKILMESEKPILISMGKGKYYKEKGELVLDLGAFTTALEYACDIKAEVIGKPSEAYFQAALSDIGLPADKVVMVGDDLAGDIAGAQSCSVRGILVRTGKFRKSDECHPSIHPDAIVDRLDEAVHEILLHKT